MSRISLRLERFLYLEANHTPYLVVSTQTQAFNRHETGPVCDAAVSWDLGDGARCRSYYHCHDINMFTTGIAPSAHRPTDAIDLDTWMASEPHRQNMLLDDYRDLGTARYGQYWCKYLLHQQIHRSQLSSPRSYGNQPLTVGAQALGWFWVAKSLWSFECLSFDCVDYSGDTVWQCS